MFCIKTATAWGSQSWPAATLISTTAEIETIPTGEKAGMAMLILKKWLMTMPQSHPIDYHGL